MVYEIINKYKNIGNWRGMKLFNTVTWKYKEFMGDEIVNTHWCLNLNALCNASVRRNQNK